jgi:hypothetical protein
MPRRHIETRNIVFHKIGISERSFLREQNTERKKYEQNYQSYHAPHGSDAERPKHRSERRQPRANHCAGVASSEEEVARRVCTSAASLTNSKPTTHTDSSQTVRRALLHLPDDES